MENLEVSIRENCGRLSGNKNSSSKGPVVGKWTPSRTNMTRTVETREGRRVK